MQTYYTYNTTTKCLARAADPATIDGKMIVHPSAAQYATLGAYTLRDTPPPTPPEGKIAVPDGFELVDASWQQAWKYEDAPPPPPRTFSKLKLYAALVQAGLWDALVAWLNAQTFEGVNAYTAFMLAQDLVEDNPYFTQWLSAAKSALGVTDEQAEAILKAAAE